MVERTNGIDIKLNIVDKTTKYISIIGHNNIMDNKYRKTKTTVSLINYHFVSTDGKVSSETVKKCVENKKHDIRK